MLTPIFRGNYGRHLPRHPHRLGKTPTHSRTRSPRTRQTTLTPPRQNSHASAARLVSRPPRLPLFRSLRQKPRSTPRPRLGLPLAPPPRHAPQRLRAIHPPHPLLSTPTQIPPPPIPQPLPTRASLRTPSQLAPGVF